MTSLAPHERLPEILVVPREKTPTGARIRVLSPFSAATLGSGRSGASSLRGAAVSSLEFCLWSNYPSHVRADVPAIMSFPGGSVADTVPAMQESQDTALGTVSPTVGLQSAPGLQHALFGAAWHPTLVFAHQ